jgi:hypothetical protein
MDNLSSTPKIAQKLYMTIIPAIYLIQKLTFV